MTNYYKQFEGFKKQLKKRDKIPLEQFKHEMMIFFGFGGRNKTVTRWLDNFNNVGLIRVIKTNNNEFVVDVL